MKKILLLILLTGCALSVAAQEYRDVVFLKNGSVIKGFYKELYPGDTLRMETLDGGTLVCPMSEVLRIAKERVDIYVMKAQETSLNQKWRPRGYRGFVEYSMGRNTDNSKVSVTSYSTIHGYQFNPHIFLGLGVQVERYNMTYQGYNIQPSDDSVPVFANARLWLLKKRISPYLDVRGGYNVLGYKGPYASAGAGVDFGFSPRTGISVSLAYQYLRDVEAPDGDQVGNYLVLRTSFHF